MNFIIGLGNPGNQYKLTKHNFGFWVVDKLIKERSLKYNAGVGDYIYAKSDQYIFIKPTDKNITKDVNPSVTPRIWGIVLIIPKLKPE